MSAGLSLAFFFILIGLAGLTVAVVELAGRLAALILWSVVFLVIGLIGLSAETDT